MQVSDPLYSPAYSLPLTSPFSPLCWLVTPLYCPVYSLPSPNQPFLALVQQQGYTRVIGVLFCCRKRYTSILQGYMQRNLRREGGLLDHIMLYNYGTMNDDPYYPAWLATQPGINHSVSLNTTYQHTLSTHLVNTTY